MPGFPEVPQHRYSISLGEAAPVQFTLRFTYRLRVEGWYLDIIDADGIDLAVGRRLSASWGPTFGIVFAGQPEGILFVRGPSRYTRDQWTNELELLHLLLSDIDTTAAEPAPAVTVL